MRMSMRRIFAPIVLLLWLSFETGQGRAQTVDFNDSSVVQPVTKRVGLNLGSLNFYDNGQVLQNLVGSLNPGFEPPVSQQIWTLDTNGTTTSFQIPDIYYSGPANYWSGGTFTVMQSESGGAEAGCSGAIQSSAGSSYPSEPTVTISVACPAAFSIGDVIVLKTVATPTPEWWWENNKAGLWASISNSGKLTSDTTDLCATCGTQALTMDATASGSTAGATWYFDAAPNLDLFVLMNGTYNISFWAKTAAGSPQITITAQRFSANGFNCGTYTKTPTSTWSPVSYTHLSIEWIGIAARCVGHAERRAQLGLLLAVPLKLLLDPLPFLAQGLQVFAAKSQVVLLAALQVRRRDCVGNRRQCGRVPASHRYADLIAAGHALDDQAAAQLPDRYGPVAVEHPSYVGGHLVQRLSKDVGTIEGQQLLPHIGIVPNRIVGPGGRIRRIPFDHRLDIDKAGRHVIGLPRNSHDRQSDQHEYADNDRSPASHPQAPGHIQIQLESIFLRGPNRV